MAILLLTKTHNIATRVIDTRITNTDPTTAPKIATQERLVLVFAVLVSSSGVVEVLNSSPCVIVDVVGDGSRRQAAGQESLVLVF